MSDIDNNHDNNGTNGNGESYEVIIIGAGVAGASAAHHLANSGVTNVLVIDAASEPGEGLGDRKSGSATMRNQVAPCVKMMVQVFAIDSAEFVKHHGTDGARRYMSATKEGLMIQKSLAKSLDETDDSLIKELGSFYVGYQEDEEELHQEFEFFRSLGSSCSDLQWYDKEMLLGIEGCPADFHCAIFFPADSVVDSSSYAKRLLTRSKVNLMMNSRVVSVADQSAEGAVVELDSHIVLRAKHVVMATGGLFQVPHLNGLIKPCYSYLVHVPTDEFSCDQSSNFFTWGFSHDWCFTNGKVRTSGEDHFSAYKDPKTKERCANLTEWTRQQYGCKHEIDPESIAQQYGVYSDTPDFVPLVGTLREDSAICHLLGCNAWGQTILSYASSLVPGLLGYQALSESQNDILKLFTIRRFTELPKC